MLDVHPLAIHKPHLQGMSVLEAIDGLHMWRNINQRWAETYFRMYMDGVQAGIGSILQRDG